jgi:hypothetical protein
MGLPVNDKKKNLSNANNAKASGGASKFIAKPGAKAVGVTKKPIKTGGSRRLSQKGSFFFISGNPHM